MKAEPFVVDEKKDSLPPPPVAVEEMETLTLAPCESGAVLIIPEAADLTRKNSEIPLQDWSTPLT